MPELRLNEKKGSIDIFVSPKKFKDFLMTKRNFSIRPTTVTENAERTPTTRSTKDERYEHLQSMEAPLGTEGRIGSDGKVLERKVAYRLVSPAEGGRVGTSESVAVRCEDHLLR